MLIILSYLVLGSVVGFMAGLLGIGGGLLIVPFLSMTLKWGGLSSEYVHHMAVATSLTSIVCTSIASARAHHMRGAVDWKVWRGLGPGLFIGTFAFSWFAAGMSSRLLEALFIIYLLYVIIQMALDIKPKPGRRMPGTISLFGAGAGIGAISSLVGIGGGSMVIPFLIWCNSPVRVAIGTSAATGLIIAVGGCIGYGMSGLNVTGLPAWSLGFIHLPSLVSIIITSIIFVNLGAYVSHRVPVPRLKRFFALFLCVVEFKMITDFFS